MPIVFPFFDFFWKNPLALSFFGSILKASNERNPTEKKIMQLQTTTRPSNFPAYTLQYLRRLANLTARYCDRIEAEKDEYTREKNYTYAMRCIFRSQKALWYNAGEISDK